MDFLKSQFDKILLSVLLILTCVLVVLLIRWNMSSEMVTWAQTMAGGFSGALLTLITGSRFTPRVTDQRENGNGKPTVPSTPTFTLPRP